MKLKHKKERDIKQWEASKDKRRMSRSRAVNCSQENHVWVVFGYVENTLEKQKSFQEERGKLIGTRGRMELNILVKERIQYVDVVVHSCGQNGEEDTYPLLRWKIFDEAAWEILNNLHAADINPHVADLEAMKPQKIKFCK